MPRPAAALIWAALYSAVGAIGGVLFDSPLVAVGAAVILSLLVTGPPALIRRIRGRSGPKLASKPANKAAGPDAGDARTAAATDADSDAPGWRAAADTDDPVRPARPSA